MRTFFFALLGLHFASFACSPNDNDCKASDQLFEKCIDEQPEPICHIENYERADKKLNRLYKELKAKMIPEEFAKVKLDQRSWLKKMDKGCQCSDCPDEGPVFECKAAETWKRAMYLQKLSRD